MKRRSLTRVLAGALGLLLLAAGWLFLGPTQLGGSTSYAVIVGTSMEPMLHRGDLAVIREESTYRAGDVVLYEAAELGSNVLHRIVRVQDGRFVLKGDNNDFLDSEQPTEEQIVGKLWLSAPQVGRVTGWLNEPSHAALLVGLATLLALAGGAGAGAARRRRSAGQGGSSRAYDAAGRRRLGRSAPLAGRTRRLGRALCPACNPRVHPPHHRHRAGRRGIRPPGPVRVFGLGPPERGVSRRARDDRRADLPPTRTQATNQVRIPARGAPARSGARPRPARCTAERRPRLGAPRAARTRTELPRRPGLRSRNASTSARCRHSSRTSAG